MADISTRIVISARDEASATLKQIGRESDALQGRWSSMQKVMSAGLGLAGVAGVSMGFDAILRDASKFETALNQVQKVSNRSLELVRQDISSLGPELGSATELVEGYYQVMSAGITDTAQAMDTLETASKLAKASGISQAEAILALAKTMNGFAGEVRNAAEVSDLLFSIEAQGIATIQQMSPYLGDLASLFKLNGASAKDMAGAFALVTQTTGSVGESATKLRALMQELLKPSTELEKVYKALGTTNFEQLVSERGFVGALKAIDEQARKTGKGVQNLFGGEAFLGILKLTTDTKKLEDAITGAGNAAGSTEKHYATWQASMDGVAATTRAVLSNLSTVVGGEFLPFISDGLNELNGLIVKNDTQLRDFAREAADKIQGISSAAKGLITTVSDLPGWAKDGMEWGIIGAFLFGTKGAAISATVGALSTVLQDVRDHMDGIVSDDAMRSLSGEKLLEKLRRNEQALENSILETQRRLSELEPGAYLQTALDVQLKEYTVRLAKTKQEIDGLIKRLFPAPTEPASIPIAPTPTAPEPSQAPTTPPAPPVADTGKANAAASALKSLTAELAKLQLTDAQYQQWQTAQKIAELEKSLGKAHPKVVELKAALEKELSANLLQSIVEYADPAAGQLAKVQKEYQRVLDTIKGDKGIGDAQKDLFNSQAARQYEKALEGVAGTTQNLAKFTQETAYIEAELSGNRDAYWAKRREQLLEELGYYTQHADKAAVLAAAEERIRVERLQKESEYSFNFAKMWEETYKRVDQAGADMIEGLLTGTKNGLDALKSMFIRMLAEMANAALLRPITVQIMGVMGGVIGGVFGGTGTANAAGQAASGGAASGGFGIPGFNVGGLFSGITDTINSTMAGWFPSTFASNTTMAQYNALVGNITGTTPGATSTFTATMAPYLAAAGFGSLGYSLIGGAMGLPQNKYTGITSALGSAGGFGLGTLAAGSSLATGTSLASGAAFGSVIPVVGTIIGALAGGLLGGLMGGKKPKRPAAWSELDLNLGGGFVADTDTPWVKELGAGYAINAEGRNKASDEYVGSFVEILSESAKVVKEQTDNLQKALPEGIAAQFKAQLADRPLSVHLDYKDKEVDENTPKEIAEKVQAEVDRVLLESFQALDLSEYTGKIDIDTTSLEGLDKFTKATTALQQVADATKAITDPVPQLVQQAEAAKEQMDEWIKSMEEFGVKSDYAKEKVEEFRLANINAALDDIETATLALTAPTSELVRQAEAAKTQMDDWAEALKVYGADMDAVTEALGKYQQATIDSLMGQLQDSIAPLSQYEQAMLAANQTVDDHKAALLELGATETEIAQVEAMRTQVLEAMLGPMRTAFEQDMRIRRAQLDGNADVIASTQLAVQHERELAEIRTKFGQSSTQYADILALQEAERSQLLVKQIATKAQQEWAEQQALAQQILQNQAKAAQDALNSANTALNTANTDLSNAQNAVNAARNAYTAALNKEASALQSTVDGITRAVEQVSRARRDLWHSENSPLSVGDRYSLAGAELDRVFAKAMSGDTDAMSELASLSADYLDASKEANADFSKYRKDFEKVQNMLAVVEASGLAQVSTAQQQIDAINAQIAAVSEGTGQIVGSLKELEAAFQAALGQYADAQKTQAEAALKAAEAAAKAAEAAEKAQQGSDQSNKTWMQDVLERKTAQLNSASGEANWVGSGAWTVADTLEAMRRISGSFEAWYAQYGQLEGFASGGLASPGWAIVGEKGPELVNFSQPGRVYTADETADMLTSRMYAMPPLPATSADSQAELVREVKELRREVAALRAEQSRSQYRIADAAQRTARTLDKWDFDGMPEARILQ